jgi:hypothetical protein
MLDQELEQNTDTEDTTDDALYCAECGHLITRTRWAISMDGHERVFINPAGRVFRVCCFSEAPGASDVGAFTSEHTWFPGFEWNFAICTACSTHIGWQFLAQDRSKSFLGLMKTALTARPNAGK